MTKKSSSKTSGLQKPVVESWKTPKKSSSKTLKPVIQNLAVEKEKPSSTHTKIGLEIDEIFSKQRKKPEHEKARNVAEGVTENPNKLKKKTSKDQKDDESSKQKKKKRKSSGSNVDVFESDQSPRPRRKTGDGLAIYTEEELRIGKADAGGTRLCPFDCDCCF